MGVVSGIGRLDNGSAADHSVPKKRLRRSFAASCQCEVKYKTLSPKGTGAMSFSCVLIFLFKCSTKIFDVLIESDSLMPNAQPER